MPSVFSRSIHPLHRILAILADSSVSRVWLFNQLRDIRHPYQLRSLTSLTPSPFSLTHPLTQSLTLSLIHSLTHSHTCTLCRSLPSSLTHLLIHLPTPSPTPSLTHSPTCLTPYPSYPPQSLAGLSTRSVVSELFSQSIVFLFLVDSETSLLVTVPAFFGIIIQAWKVRIVEVKTKRQIFWFSRRESTNIRDFDWSFSKYLLKEREILSFSCDRNNRVLQSYLVRDM